MAITKFVPELWSAAVQLPFERALVYGQPTVSNRKYEGEIRQMGDTVHVTSILDPTVRKYDKATDLQVEDLADDQADLKIDQGDYFNFRVNDVDKVQAAGDFQGPATQRAGFRMKDQLDRYIASLYTGAAKANQLGAIEVAKTSPEAAYDVLVELGVKLDEADCPTDGRYVIVPPDFHGVLLRDDRFVRADASGSEQGLRNGIVGRAAGFDVLKSNNCPSPSAGERIVQAGIPDALSVAQQIVETEALRSQARFADLVRGLNIYGAKLFRPEGIATAQVKVSGGTAPQPPEGDGKVAQKVQGKV
ncbi:phage major capsid protein [Streptomyces celluloflavus]|uniref:phage major capsid protein n=1 Tax=Streptomyces celluloflavus TaxID=58344 RepID=UPI0036897452